MKIIFSTEDLFIVEPLGIMQMIAFAKKLGHRCLFATFGDNSLIETVKREKPDVVAISIMSISDKKCRKAIKEIKDYNRNIFVIAGGPHPTYYPAFIKDSEADAICVGEGDYAFPDVLKSLEAGESLEKISNIYTKSSVNQPRNLIENLDELPFLDRDLVYQNSRLGKSKLKSFMATRGCPYSCTYCFNSGYKELYKGKGRILRRRNVGNLLEEIKKVRERYPLEIIRFGDDVFVEKMNDWFFEFIDKYPKIVRLPFYCILSPKVVTFEMAKILKKVGCVSVGMSIETGNEKMRYEVLKRQVSDDEIIKACRALIDNGIKTFTNIMVGLPYATLEDEMKSLNLAFKCRTTYASFTIFTPFPGTELFNQCIKQKLIAEININVFPRSVMDRSSLNCFSEKEKDIQKNIVLLGALANGSRILRKLVLKYFIFLPSNKLFFYISFLVRNYYSYRHIWPMSLSAKEFFGYVKLVLRHDRKYIE